MSRDETPEIEQSAYDICCKLEDIYDKLEWNAKVRLIKLPNGIYINPVHVQTVKITPATDFKQVMITPVSGDSMLVTPPVSQTAEDLLAEIVALITGVDTQ